MSDFILGFKALADQIPDIVGESVENEHWNGDGSQIQGTRNGLLEWRKADNWTAFTDGYRTWVNGPNGIEVRLNTERFDWEHDDRRDYRPTVLYMPLAASSQTYPFLVGADGRAAIKGFAVHGTRSGVRRPSSLEFPGSASWETIRTDGCGANATIGDDVVAIHAPWTRWAWHARRASRYYISVELAQGTGDDEITDGQVRAFCWVVIQAREVHPDVPLSFRTHAELENEGETGPNPETGRNDGKTDLWPYGDPRADEFRARGSARLAELGLAA